MRLCQDSHNPESTFAHISQIEGESGESELRAVKRVVCEYQLRSRLRLFLSIVVHSVLQLPSVLVRPHETRPLPRRVVVGYHPLVLARLNVFAKALVVDWGEDESLGIC